MIMSNKQKIQYPVLAIDFGLRHIGLAVSDESGLIATPVDTINIKNPQKLGPAFEKINEIIAKWQVKTILLGNPQAFTNSQKKTLAKVNQFEKELKTAIHKPIFKYDESYSTIRAQDMLRLQGKTSRSTKHKIDKVASAVFLQEFLNLQNRKRGKPKHNN